ncbi:MAG: hypothetical protein B7Z73_15330 [Planctomycetia bacterium 21-64-5]|nr:MAG: hypothetical protein B7Z73_15330 [Planctomycetia bacterium 21-64-5]HQU47332.1 hypothetical protein [Pirellulales bacterium]
MSRPTTQRLCRTAAFAGFVLIAGLAADKGKGILFPDWSKPTKGSYDKPAAEIGKKATQDQPWTVTTVASSINGKPVSGEPVVAVGEIIDISCYLQVGKHGDKHRDCGQKCARHGQPIGLLTEEGHVYTLIDEEHDPRRDGDTALRTELIDHMAEIVKIHGTLTEVAGQKAIYITGTAQPKKK